MPAYDKKAARKSKAYKSFKKYVLRGKRFSKRQRLRLFFSKAEGTIKAYTKIIKGYVKYMHRKEHAEAYPITETSLRRYIDTLSTRKDRTKFPMIKPAIIFGMSKRTRDNLQHIWSNSRRSFKRSRSTIQTANQDEQHQRIEYQEVHSQMFIRQKFQTAIQRELSRIQDRPPMPYIPRVATIARIAKQPLLSAILHEKPLFFRPWMVDNWSGRWGVRQ